MQGTGSPLSLPLCAELAGQILRHLDLQSLRSAARLNSWWNAVANERLWRKVTIDARRAGCAADASPPEIRATLMRMCQAVNRPGRAACLRCVEIDVRQWLKTGQDGSEQDALNSLFDYMCSTLAACPELETLEIKVRHHRRELAERLSMGSMQGSFSFRLKKLDASLTIVDGLGPFLHQQNDITKWSVYWLRPHPTVIPQLASPLPHGALHLMDTLWSSAAQANHVLRHRAIEQLELTDADFLSLSLLEDGPFDTVEHLAFRAMADRDDLDASLAAAIEKFARTFPNVQYLRICTHPDYWPSLEVFSALGRFQRPYRLSWVGKHLFPKKFIPPHRPNDIPDEEWWLQFLMMVSVEAPMVRVVEVHRHGSDDAIWTWGYERVKQDELITVHVNPPALIDNGIQVIMRRQWLWTCGVFAVIAEEIVHADGRRTLDARITDENEDLSEDGYSEGDSMEE